MNETVVEKTREIITKWWGKFVADEKDEEELSEVPNRINSVENLIKRLKKGDVLKDD